MLCCSWQDSERVLNKAKRLFRCQSGLVVWLESQGSLVRFPRETYIFILLFFFRLFPFLTAWPSPWKWNQVWPFTSRYDCIRPRIRFIIHCLCIFKCVSLWKHGFSGLSEGWVPVNQFNHTSWIAVVSPIDHPNVVRNHCLIQILVAFLCCQFVVEFSLDIGQITVFLFINAV